jgi:peptide/nickel transport system substrate-binding protein
LYKFKEEQVKHNRLLVFIVALMSFSLIVTACAPKAVATTAAPVVEKPTAVPATAAPTAVPPEPTPTPRPPYNPASFKKVITGDCKNGQIIKEIAAVDDLTVKFSLCQPDPAFEQKAAFSAFAIQPKAYLEKAMVDRSILAKPVGTGPYMLDKWNRGDSVVLKRFDDYWGAKAKTAQVIFKWSKEAAARLLELQSGTVDGIDNPGVDDIAKIEADPTLQYKDRLANNTLYVGFNNKFKPFDDVRVRQAIAMGIDRARIVKNFFAPGSEVAEYLTPCTIPNGCVGDSWYKFDAAKAKDLLKQAGFPDGFKTTITLRTAVRAYIPDPPAIATEVQAQLKQNLNIDAQIVVLESGAMLDKAAAGTIEGIHLLGWNGDYPHITNWMDFHFSATQKQFGAPFKEIYEPLAKAAQIADAAKAKSLYVEANNAARNLVPLVPVAHSASGAAYRADVKNAHASPLGMEYFAVMTPGSRDKFVFMQNEEPISLFCNDESDGESLRACDQVLESLLGFKPGTQEVTAGLATKCSPNADLTEWTCNLRKGVKFHDGSALTADDVVMSWWLSWDYAMPLHIGNTGAFEYFATLWGNYLHAPG